MNRDNAHGITGTGCYGSVETKNTGFSGGGSDQVNAGDEAGVR